MEPIRRPRRPLRTSPWATTLALCLVATLLAAPAGAQDAGDEEEPQHPSPEWTARELANYERANQAARDQAADPQFMVRWQEQSQENYLEYQQRGADDPDWNSEGNVCASWAEQCTGDPFRYPGVDPFYDDAVVEPVAFLDRGGARLSGRVWAPSGGGDALPGAVIINGSVQAPETLYWWGAQALVRAGYVVLTFDPRGQGRSDNRTPDGEQGSNANPDVFATNLIDAIDFFRSTPDAPYEPNEGDERKTTPHNPLWERIDRDRLGVIGHSLGARGVSVVQGIQPWPGTGEANPVDVAVAWDNLALSEGGGPGGGLAGFDLVPRVPAMGQAGDYFLTPTPYTSPPDPDDKRQGYLTWVEAGVPSYQLNIQAGTHYEWSLLPTFPTTAWEPGGEGGWGNPLARHYTVAWLDRWLKQPGEPGHGDADARLLADEARPEADDLQGGEEPAPWCDRLSFYFTSSRAFPARDGTVHVTDDIRAECLGAAAAPGDEEPAEEPAPSEGEGGEATPPPEPPPASDLPATGGNLTVFALAALGFGGMLRGRPLRAGGRSPERR
jgi:hypothetical protein